MHAPSAPPASAAGDGPRLSGLDGLRGVAACVVVFHHLALTNPALAESYRSVDDSAAPVWVRVVTNSPVHLLWQGTEAVVLFFALSGLVLVLPRLTRRGGWPAYYVARLVRLYLPVWAALALAVVAAAILYPQAPSAVDWWLDQHAGLGPIDAARDAPLVFGVSDLDSPLWSLQWEVLFSLLLPLYVVFARRCRTRAGAFAGLGTLAGLTVIGKLIGSPGLQYLVIFGFGSLIAARMGALHALCARIARIRCAWIALLAAALILLNADWILRGLSGVPLSVLSLGRVFDIAGGCILIWLAIAQRSVRDALSSAPFRWLGSRSFSLYLVHEPVVVGTAFLVGPGSTLLIAAIALPVSLGLTEAFFRCVERPSHRLSRYLGRLIGARRRLQAAA